ncbi:molecular chaperone TorD, partial [Escherichia coli]|nr:molecular chaperone TorD [Escherichia coli]
MQEVKAFNEKRAEIYWWFSSLFAKELSEKELETYHSVEIRSFLAGLGENESLKPAVDRLVDALNRLQDRNDAQLELAADFCE